MEARTSRQPRVGTGGPHAQAGKQVKAGTTRHNRAQPGTTTGRHRRNSKKVLADKKKAQAGTTRRRQRQAEAGATTYSHV